MKTVTISYFSDVLCVWAYITQLRVDEIKARFGDQVRIEPRVCSVFGDTARKMAAQWKDRGGYEGFNAHLRQAAGQFPEVGLNPNVWLTVRPASSGAAHLFIKAAQLAEAKAAIAPGAAERLTWDLRRAFFEDARDIARRDVQRAVAREAGIAVARLDAHVNDGSAFAALCSDHQDADALGVQGSPSFVLNDGRQKLYGNVGYRVIDANIRELLRAPSADQASWC